MVAGEKYGWETFLVSRMSISDILARQAVVLTMHQSVLPGCHMHAALYLICLFDTIMLPILDHLLQYSIIHVWCLS